ELALSDVAHTLFHARQHFDVRRVLAVESRDEALRALADPDAPRVYTQLRRERPSIVFMFPGGGAQYPRMGAGLLAGDPVYREQIERGLSLAEQRFGLQLRPLLLPQAGDEQAARELERPSLQLPLLFIVEHALAQRWLARGVKPAALIGHSMGENTAACIAGVMDFTTTLGLIALRGRLFESLPDGGMLSVPLSAAELTPLLPADVVVACENAPNLSVASGPRASLDQLASSLAARGSEAQSIRIRIAAHSPMLEPILREFGDYLRSVKLSPPRIPIVSNLSGEILSDRDATDPEYWVRHLRNTVRFARGIETLQADGDRIYLEVGPGRALGALVRQNLNDPQADAPIASLRRPDEPVDDESFWLAAIGRLWASGADIDLATLIAPGQRVALPTYAFDHKPYFIAPGKLAAVSGGLSRIAAIEDWFFQPIWRWRELEREELSGPAKQTYLLFADERGVADRLAQRLQDAGHRTVFVRKSGAYGQTDVLEYEVAPHAPHSYATLVQELSASEKLPDRIIHLWSLDAGALVEEEPEWAYHPVHRELTFDSLFHLMRAFGTESVVKPMHLSVVTTGAIRLMAEPLPHPEQALVKGIVQVIPRESPNLSATWVDLPQPRRVRSWLRAGQLDNLEELSGWLENEARSQRKSGTIAYRDGRRFEQDHEPAPRTAANSTSRLRERGVYVITGGLGGIGLAIARHLATQHRARLILLGRHPLPPREQWAEVAASDRAIARRVRAVMELEASGAEIEVASVDVGDLDAMRNALEQARRRFGRIDGAFHAAGVLDDRLIALKSLADANQILRPKVDGTVVLDRLGHEFGLELLVLFSSTSVLIGPPGQADYVAANAFMDAYAESRRGRPGPLTVAIQWGVWRDVGMAAEAARAMGAVASTRTPSKIQGAFFDTRLDAADGGVILEGRHDARQTWWLNDHRLSDGTAVVPGTGYLQLMAAGASALGLRRPFEIYDATFLRPLVVADDTSKSIRLRIRPDDRGYSFEVQSIYAEQGVDMGYLTHAVARVATVEDRISLPPPLDLNAIRARANLRVLERAESIRTSQETHLRFGPRFRVLRKAYFGEREALGELSLDPEIASDVDGTSLHAGLLDLGTGFAMELIPSYDSSQGLWAPLSYRRLRLQAPLPAQCVAWVRPHGSNRNGRVDAGIAFDVTLCDPQGGICVEVEELMLRRVPLGQTLAQVARPEARELEPDPALAAIRNKTAPSPAEAAFRA
ncbi:MAG TPA: SDR family NAD(P)-dependent oxidoreductase, partial [Polyangiales bacterium]|nr:SDR family NAD(P)-dependent oxidoreductase [Polyangiales bacterium]